MARLEEQARVRGYRNYVTDILRGVFAPDAERYATSFTAKVETRTADEIRASIKDKLRAIHESV